MLQRLRASEQSSDPAYLGADLGADLAADSDHGKPQSRRTSFDVVLENAERSRRRHKTIDALEDDLLSRGISSKSTSSTGGYLRSQRSFTDRAGLGAVIQPPEQVAKLSPTPRQSASDRPLELFRRSIDHTMSPRFEAKPIWDGVDEVAKPSSRAHPCDCASRWRAGCYVIDPWKGKMLAWGALMMLITIASAILIPYEMAFIPHDSGILFWIQRFFDACFFIDIVLRFFTMYYSADDDARWIRDPRAIVINYLRRDFIIDLVGLIPTDLFAVGWRGHVDGLQMAALRPLVVLRLMNVARIGRLVSLRQCYRDGFGLSFAMLRIPDNICCTLYCAHLMACAWGFVGQLDGPEGSGDVRQGWTGALQRTKDEETSNMEDHGAIRLYIRSLYWSVMTITAIGYGDICPITDAEYFVSTVAMSVGAIIWVYAIGKICSVIDTFNQRSRDRDKTMDDLERMMRNEHLPMQDRRELRWFFARRHMSSNMSSHLELLESMSPSLQAEVARRQIQDWLTHVPWMRDICGSALVLMQCRRALKITMFCEGEHMDLSQALCALRRGVALKGLIVLCRGSVWGAMDVFLTNHELMDPDTPIALNFVEVMHLSRQAVEALVQAFPSTKKRMQKARIRAICLRGVKFKAKVIKARTDSGTSLGRHSPRGVRFSDGEEYADFMDPTRSLKLQRVSVDDNIAGLQQCHEALNTKLDILVKRIASLSRTTSNRSILSRSPFSGPPEKPSLSHTTTPMTVTSAASQKIRSIARRSMNALHEVEGAILPSAGKRASQLLRGLHLNHSSSHESMASDREGSIPG